MGKETVKDVVGNLHAFQIIVKVSPDWICAVTSRFTKLFYCEGANIAHIQSGDTLDAGDRFQSIIEDATKVSGLPTAWVR